MARKIFVTSFKGGTGVTTFCAGLGMALASFGERTLIVDGDNRSGGGLVAAGLGNMQVYTLADYEKGGCRAKQTLITHPDESNLCYCSSLGLISNAAAIKAVNDLDGLFDYILLDKTASEICNEALIVTDPYLPSIKSADCCRSYLSDGGIKKIGLVVNRLSGGQLLNGEVMSAQEIAVLLHMPLTAVIPEDLTLTAGRKRPDTEKAFRIAADAISGKREGICNVLRQYTGAGGYIKRKMRDKI